MIRYVNHEVLKNVARFYKKSDVNLISTLKSANAYRFFDSYEPAHNE